MTDGAPKPESAFRSSVNLLFTRRFGVFCLASLLSNLGTWAQQVAQPWLLLSLGASSMLLGLDAFAMGAPVWLLTLMGGALADRGDRRRVIASFQSIQMLCPIALVALILFGVIQPWMVVALSVVVGVTDALSMPSFQTIAPTIVDPDQLPSALALNATQFNLSRILGPALAGVLMASLGAVGCFALNAASYAPFILVALWILPARTQAATPANAAVRWAILAGLRDVYAAPRLRATIFMVFATSLLCGPLITFAPVLVRDAFQGDVTHFSLMIGAFGAGGLLGAIALLGVAPGRDRRWLCVVAAASYATVLGFVAIDPWLWALPILLMLSGFSMTIANTSANTFLQSTSPPGLRGHTVSVYMLSMRGGVSIGSLITGLSVHAIGVRHALLINAALALIAVAAVGSFWLRAPAAGSAPAI